MLTRKQQELLLFIHERMKESGVPPSFDEMKDALDLASKSGIHRLITALEERGFIRRLPNRARALEVVKLPDSMNPSLGGRRALLADDNDAAELRTSTAATAGTGPGDSPSPPPPPPPPPPAGAPPLPPPPPQATIIAAASTAIR